MSPPAPPAANSPASGDRRAFDRPGAWRRALPFAATGLLVVPGVILSPPDEPAWFLAGLVVIALVIVATFVVPWSRVPPAFEALPPLGFIAAVGLFRQGAGGATAGYAPLVLLGILWLAIYGTRRQAFVALAVGIAVLTVPIVVVGAPLYPVGEWLRAAVLAAMGGLVVLSIGRLVEELRNQAERLAHQREAAATQAATTRSILETAGELVVSCDESGRIAAVNSAAARMLGRSEGDLVGLGLIETVVAPEHRRRMQIGFARILAGSTPPGGGDWLETTIVDGAGRRIPVEVSVTITGAPGARSIHAIARDISARSRTDAAAREHLDDLARLLSVARDLGRPASATDGRQAICDAARELAGADLALFFEARPDERLLVSTGASGAVGVPDGVTLDVRQSMTAMVFASGAAVFVGDLLTDGRVDRATAVRINVRAAYWQPVLRDGRPIGILVVYWRTVQASVSQRVRSLLELFATQAAVVVERADLMGRLESLARTDPLTNLANRRALEESLIRELARAERAERALSVVLLDLDRFKRYNDRRGHQAGDTLLRAVADGWGRQLRPTDTLARFGGEEFLAVLPDCDTGTAVRTADRLRDAVPGAETVSAGVATWDRRETMSELIARADAALYEAKRKGRDRTEVAVDRPTFESAPTPRARRVPATPTT